jgi:hypothetical protein
MYILLKIMSTVPTCLKDMQDEMEKVIGSAFLCHCPKKKDRNHIKKVKIPLVKRF